MRTILVGVDASDRAKDAIAFAGTIASASGASVLVATACPYDPGLSRVPETAYRRALEEMAQALVDRMSHPLEHLGADRVRTEVVDRLSPAHALHHLAVREQADLVVVGSAGLGTLGRVLPGTTGERLLHGAPCPVAVVPEGYAEHDHLIRRIGVAHDGSAEASSALAAGIELARAHRGELEVIRVLEAIPYGSAALMSSAALVVPREELEREARAGLAEALETVPSDTAAEPVLLEGDAAHEIAERSGSLDVLVTGSRGYGPLRAVLVGGVTGRLVRTASCPVIVVPRGVSEPFSGLAAEVRGAVA